MAFIYTSGYSIMLLTCFGVFYFNPLVYCGIIIILVLITRPLEHIAISGREKNTKENIKLEQNYNFLKTGFYFYAKIIELIFLPLQIH